MNRLDQKFAELTRSISRLKKATAKNKHKKTVGEFLRVSSNRERDTWLEDNSYRI